MNSAQKTSASSQKQTDESAECNLRIVVEEVMDRIYQFTKNKAPPLQFYTIKFHHVFQFAGKRTQFQAICPKHFRFLLFLSPQFSRPFTIRWKNLRY